VELAAGVQASVTFAATAGTAPNRLAKTATNATAGTHQARIAQLFTDAAAPRASDNKVSKYLFLKRRKQLREAFAGT
jgi:hypothetical protein